MICRLIFLIGLFGSPLLDAGEVKELSKPPGRRFLVWLKVDEHYDLCRGVLIGEQYVLTTATCLTDIKPDMITAVTGKSEFTDENGEVHGVENFDIHPDFEKANGENYPEFDIAVIKLVDHVRPNERQDFLRLPRKNIDLPRLGFSLSTNSSTGDKLEEFQVMIIRDSNPVHKGTELWMSALNMNINWAPCDDEMGSALVSNNTVVGILSTPACSPWGINQYIPVFNCLGFINQVIFHYSK